MYMGPMKLTGIAPASLHRERKLIFQACFGASCQFQGQKHPMKRPKPTTRVRPRADRYIHGEMAEYRLGNWGCLIPFFQWSYGTLLGSLVLGPNLEAPNPGFSDATNPPTGPWVPVGPHLCRWLESTEPGFNRKCEPAVYITSSPWWLRLEMS